MICPEADTIFIHIPKCGGISIQTLLQARGFRKAFVLNDHQDLIRSRAYLSGHAALMARHMDSLLWAKSFKFTVCRNPYDRLVSGWSFCTQQGQLDAPFDYFVRKLETFDSFWVSWHCGLSQKEHLLINGRADIDLVCRLEHLSSDLAPIAERLGEPGLEIPHLNRSSHPARHEMYSRDLQDIVFERFAGDFEYFGYDYDL